MENIDFSDDNQRKAIFCKCVSAAVDNIHTILTENNLTTSICSKKMSLIAQILSNITSNVFVSIVYGLPETQKNQLIEAFVEDFIDKVERTLDEIKKTGKHVGEIEC